MTKWLLETQSLSKRFGGLEAVKSVDLKVEKGEIRAIIGPNGAGKTTLVSLISGRITPTSGKIFFNGTEITKLPAHKRASMGIVYTFQIMSLFPSLTVFESVALAVQRKIGLSIAAGKKFESDVSHVWKFLRSIGLEDYAEREVGSLPYGHQRLVDIAMSISLQPELLILDEPTQGLSVGEIQKIMELIKDISKTTTILLIEHNIRVVMELAGKITVMANGSVIAEGSPSEVENDIAVQRVYLGV